MELRRVAPLAGIVGTLATLLVVAAPELLLTETGTGLALYYGSGPLGVGGVAFLAAILLIVFLSARHERQDPVTIAGVAVVGAVALFGFALLWALAVDQENVFSFSAAWMSYHRWLVVGATGVVVAAAGGYTREVLG